MAPEIYDVDKDPIMLAAKTGDYELMDRLVADGADLTHSHENGTPLAQACISNEYKSTKEKIRFIDKYWGDIMGEDIKQFYHQCERICPFINAIKKNDINLVKYLVKKGVKASNDALEFAINYENVNVEMVKIIHEGLGSDLNMKHLEQACIRESFDVIIYMLNTDKLYHLYKAKVLHKLVFENHLILVEIFLGCKILPSENTVKEALQYGCFDMIKLFIDYGVMRINTEELLLRFNFEKIRFHNQNTVKEIIGYFVYLGVNIDAKDYDGYTALSKLCKYESNLPIIEVFVQLGANIQAVSKGKIEACPLMVAAEKGCTNILRFLIENGADPYIIDSNRWNCYLRALYRSGNVEAIKFTRPFFDEAYMNYKPEEFESLKRNCLTRDKWT